MKHASAAIGALAITIILYSFAGLRGAVDTCKWFDDNITDRSISALTHQTDLLYNRIALPADADVTARGTAVTEQGEQLVDFNLHNATICTAAEALYGPTPSPSPSP
ncbi:MAG: hypothetical protein JO113_04135 [Candidatus Eremiobacteraeota bacterium]|nr:hypothetical protein [Candidatus Eremiobacteraeota bacterium]